MQGALAGEYHNFLAAIEHVGGMVQVSLRDQPLTASGALVWSAGLPRPLQQILFETADSLTAPAPPRPARLVSLSTA